jgi:SAM-dependent methyltransferase
MRALVRDLLYATPLHRVGEWARRRLDTDRFAPTGALWSAALTGPFRPYLGGTVGNDVRNAVTVQLLRHSAHDPRSLLDVGCAGGTLAGHARAAGVERYVGIDVSGVAVGIAQTAPGEFQVADLRAFDPAAHGRFDAIVFNEVLYYLDVRESVAEVARYARALAPRGVIVVGMKDDAKSRAIFHRAARGFRWVTGMLLQEQPASARYAVRGGDRERPAYLLGVIRPEASDSRGGDR